MKPGGLTLAASRGRHRLEARLGDDLGQGDPFDLFVRVHENAQADQAHAALSAQWLKGAAPPEQPVAETRFSTLHLRALQALDAVQDGASQRDVAAALFGIDATRARWSADSELRAQVRHLLRRANALMLGGYRALASLPAQGDKQVG